MFRQGIELYPYQRDVVEGIKEFEARGIFVDMRGHYVITEPFGSGKTYTTLALIMESPLPPLHPVDIHFDTLKPYFQLSPRSVNQIIRPTAIIVARSVIAQYAHVIETATTLRAFVVQDIVTTMKLVDMIKNGDINAYDIVLIKHGLSTQVKHYVQSRDWMSGTTQYNLKSQDLTWVINNETFPRIWSRVIYDDCDAVDSATCLRAVSSIFVTGAIDHRYIRHPPNTARCDHVCDTLIVHDLRSILHHMPRVTHIGLNHDLIGSELIWTTYGHTAAQIEQSVKLYGIVWRNVLIRDTSRIEAESMIERLAGDHSDILAMIHSDACETAAQALHIESTTPYALFAAILGANKDDYETLRARITCIDRARIDCGHIINDLDSYAHVESCASGDDGARELKVQLIEKGLARDIIHTAKRSVSLYQESRAPSLLSICRCATRGREELCASLEQMNRGFDRIRENIAERSCMICYESLDAMSIVIMKCCGLPLCVQCTLRATDITQRRETKKMEDGRSQIIMHLSARCPQCRRTIDPRRDFIMISAEDHGAVDRANDFLMNITRAARAIQSTDTDRKCTEQHESMRQLLRDDSERDDSERAGTSANAAADSSDCAQSRAVRAKSDCAHQPSDGMREPINKGTYILSIIRGTPLDARDEITIDEKIITSENVSELRVPGILVGTEILRAHDHPRKVLICTAYDETITRIDAMLREAGISTEVLSGSSYEMRDALRNFAQSTCPVLFVRVDTVWSGIDMSMVSDIIIVSAKWEKHLGQIIGRAQRIGRHTSLNVHILQYVR